MGLKLKIDDGDEISIPACFADSNLSLAELGALFCFTAMSETGTGVARFERAEPEFLEASKSLKEKGILLMKIEGKSLKMYLDFDKVQPFDSEPESGVKA